MTVIDATYRFRVPEFSVGDRLAKAREDANITQVRMGELLGCSRRTVVRYENSSTPPRAVVLAYHVATETDLGWLETGKAGITADLSEMCTPRDLNPEPTDSGTAAVPVLAEVVELRPSAEHIERKAA